jgi:D-ribose pyranase
MPERRLRFPIIATWFDMKKTPVLNIALSQLIASLGHGDMIVIGDAGLPAPPGVALIDLALTRGIPGFIDTLQAVMTEMQIDSHVLADELPAHSPLLAAKIDAMGLPERRGVPHEKFKLLSQNARAIIRTGECTPYANIILLAGVVF